MSKNKYNISNIYNYFIGWYRYYFYYYCPSLLRSHIKQQIDFRIKWMDKTCYENGSCSLCGCTTTALQCANKSCDKPCYPTIMSKKDWNKFIKGSLLYKDKNGLWEYFPETKEVLGEDWNEELVLYTKKLKYQELKKIKIWGGKKQENI